MALSITGGDGNVASQANTQSPQTSTASAAAVSGSAARGGSVQPGTADSLLRQSQGGVALGGQALTTVDLSGTTAQTTASDTAQPAPAQHHVNTVALGLVAGLVLVAVIVTVAISRSAKNTTK